MASPPGVVLLLGIVDYPDVVWCSWYHGAVNIFRKYTLVVLGEFCDCAYGRFVFSSGEEPNATADVDVVSVSICSRMYFGVLGSGRWPRLGWVRFVVVLQISYGVSDVGGCNLESFEL